MGSGSLWRGGGRGRPMGRGIMMVCTFMEFAASGHACICLSNVMLLVVVTSTLNKWCNEI
jgi:hypothetical protein